jgi:hypothetical protein
LDQVDCQSLSAKWTSDRVRRRDGGEDPCSHAWSVGAERSNVIATIPAYIVSTTRRSVSSQRIQVLARASLSFRGQGPDRNLLQERAYQSVPVQTHLQRCRPPTLAVVALPFLGLPHGGLRICPAPPDEVIHSAHLSSRKMQQQQPRACYNQCLWIHRCRQILRRQRPMPSFILSWNESKVSKTHIRLYRHGMPTASKVESAPSVSRGG